MFTSTYLYGPWKERKHCFLKKNIFIFVRILILPGPPSPRPLMWWGSCGRGRPGRSRSLGGGPHFFVKKILKLICLDFWWETYTGTFILPDLFEIAVEYDVPLAGGVDGLQHGTGGKKKTKKNIFGLFWETERCFFSYRKSELCGFSCQSEIL